MENEIFNYSLYQGFVHPDICKQLLKAGLYVNTIYKWVQIKGAYKLRTYEFDYEKTYQQALANLDFTNPPDASFPAFQLMDMEKAIPDYDHRREEKMHRVHIVNQSILSAGISDRLPDAFANILLQGIQKKVFDLKPLILLLEQKRVEQ